jgi:hypothetical protein
MLITGNTGGQSPAAAQPSSPLSTLNRLVRQFDFEEAEHAPYTMPINFYRYIAPDQGFPPFGRMRLTSEAAYRGRWSFGFDLDGGSLSARVPTAVIPVLPGGDYAVSAWIRTLGLTHARARLAARLHDSHGNVIPESQTYGALLQTRGAWEHTSIEVFGDFDQAADLVVELQVLQPQQFTWPHQDSKQPLVQDVSGRAWFDEVVVWQQPRIELSTGSPGNVVAGAEKPILHALVRDPTADRLAARLRIFDIDGQTVRDEGFDLPQGSWSKSIELAHLEHGWYRAKLEVRHRDGVTTGRSLDFVLLPERRRGPAPDEHRFGVVLPTPGNEPAGTTLQLVRRLGIASATLPLGDVAGVPSPGLEVDPPLRGMLDELAGSNVELTIALPRVPEALARRLGVDPTQVLELLGRDPDLWRDPLGDLFMELGLGVERWQLGLPEAIVGLPPARLQSLVVAAAAALAELVTEPIILVPSTADEDPPALPPPHGYSITVPSQLGLEALEASASRWSNGERPVLATLERAPQDRGLPDERVTDLLLRALYGWRAGLPHMVITAPWARRGGHRGQTMPDPSFGVWRVLADRLRGRSFQGELPLAAGLRGWIITGPGQTAVVAWNERATTETTVVSMLLADGPVSVVDAFGNRRTVFPEDGAHTFTVGRRPLFIEGVDGRLASFRAQVAIRPSFIPARYQVHEREVVLGNPWNVTISGTIRLEPPVNWRITPRIHPFVVRPGAETRLPISVVFDRSAITAPTRIEAEVELTADRDYRLRVHTDLDVGWKNIEFAADWSVQANDRTGADDLVITQQVTNTGDGPVNLDVYVSAAEVSRQRRAIGALGPNQTAVRTFRVPGGAHLLAGKRVRVGVTERDGTARLNRFLDIPPQPTTRPDERLASEDSGERD